MTCFALLLKNRCDVFCESDLWFGCLCLAADDLRQYQNGNGYQNRDLELGSPHPRAPLVGLILPFRIARSLWYIARRQDGQENKSF
jgi:hypothetical protein